MLKRILILLTIALGLVGFSAINASAAEAKGKPVVVSGPVVQVAPATKDAGSVVRYVVNTINAGATNVTLVQAKDCTGPFCIKIGILDAHPAGTCTNTFGGCAYTWPGDPEQICYVSLTSNLKPFNKDLPNAVGTHEVLHCLGLGHRTYDEDPLTIMASTIGAYNPTMVPSAGDFAILNDLWADGYQAPAV